MARQDYNKTVEDFNAYIRRFPYNLTAKITGSLLDLVPVAHVMSGHVIEVSGKRLLVEEACSGVHSLFSVLTSAFFFLLWTRCPPIRSALVLAEEVEHDRENFRLRTPCLTR